MEEYYLPSELKTDVWKLAFLRSKLTLISMKNLLLLYHKSAILALVHGILSLKLVKKISNFD